MPVITADDYEKLQKLREIRSTFECFGVAVALDHVVICGQVIHRPSWLSPSQWLDRWEFVR